jgi:hypothetical protein
MFRVAIVMADGKVVKPEDLSTATELQQAVEKARQLIRDGERLADSKRPPRAPVKAPYS